MGGLLQRFLQRFDVLVKVLDRHVCQVVEGVRREKVAGHQRVVSLTPVPRSLSLERWPDVGQSRDVKLDILTNHGVGPAKQVVYLLQVLFPGVHLPSLGVDVPLPKLLLSLV